LTQEALLPLILKKDEGILFRCVTCVQKIAMQVLYDLTNYRKEPEDELQEVFIRVWNKRDS
jgi:DNA-directed RNA polymerase specialized sigma24 family protein